MGTYGGTHFFSWKTPHACFDAAEAPPDLPDNEQELIPPPLGNNSGRAYWTLLVSTLYVRPFSSRSSGVADRSFTPGASLRSPHIWYTIPRAR